MGKLLKSKWFWVLSTVAILLIIGFLVGIKIGKLITNYRKAREEALKQKSLIAEVADLPITKLEFQSALNRELLRVFYILGVMRAADRGDMKIKTFRQLVDDKILELLGKEHKIKVEKEEIDKRIAKIKEGLFKPEEGISDNEKYFDSMVRLMGFRSEKEFRDSIKYEILEHKLAKKIFPDVKISEEEVENEVPFIELQQIFLQFSPETKATIYEKAKKIHQMLLNGQSFDELAKKYSNEVFSVVGGRLGWRKKGEMLPLYWQEVSKLKVGEISNVLDLDIGGYLIIKCLNRRAPGDKTYETIKAVIREVAKVNKRKNKFLFYFISKKNELGKQNKIKIYDPYLLANKYVVQGDYETAIKYLNESLKLDGEDPYVHMEIAILLQKKDKHDEAEKEFQKAIKLAPQDGFLYLKLGDAYLQKGDLAKAILQFQKASTLAKYDFEMHQYLEKVYTQLGMLKDAELEHERYIEALKRRRPAETTRMQAPKGTIEKKIPEFEIRELR